MEVVAGGDSVHPGTQGSFLLGLAYYPQNGFIFPIQGEIERFFMIETRHLIGGWTNGDIVPKK